MKNEQAKNKFLSSTEKNLFISTIRDDTVVLKNGGLRAILLTSSVNFALKNEDEQEGIVQGYVALLNSIDFPLQICIQSRPLNIDGYVAKIDQRLRAVNNDLIRVQLEEYRRYIIELLSLGEIMNKRFYVVVPYQPGSGGKKKFFEQLTDVLSPTKVISLSKEKFNEYKAELERRVTLIEAGLEGMGLKSVRLDTQSLIEALYNTYNPLVSQFEKLAELNDLNLEK
jgi:hypothetical protein